MVSNNPSPAEGFYLDPNGMALPGFGPFPPANVDSSSSEAAAAVAEDLSKKVRKPYTITKSRESWTEPEHDKFLEALQLFDRDWKKIEAFIGSKTVIQIRSHAQKYFLKVQKSGTGEHLPPPRPKRKAAHPYPQKAPKAALVPSEPSESFHAPPAFHSGSAIHPDSLSVPGNSDDQINSRTNNPMPVPSLSTAAKGSKVIKSCSSTNNTPRIPSTESFDQTQSGHGLRVLPDFVQVYTFIGSVFDPNASGHLQKLKSMDPIDIETVLLLMRNLSINLTSPDFEDHRRLLSTCEMDMGTIIEESSPGNLCCDAQKNLA
ncbi:hypothetical protein MLD38_002894 [Melastoma candidum]|uniref:Uncharacterized protein n=1 Tax=Melastoma candidum TaxID=119954 RepID=A0ACB9S2T1_9MYRT|nr:hypothetical protein MLD38_002894 [Melastoma candidum]